MNILEDSSVNLLELGGETTPTASLKKVGKTATYAALADGNPETFNKVSEEFSTQGYSREAEQLIATLKDMRKIEAKQIVEEAAATADVDEMVDMIKGLQSYEMESTDDKVLGVAALTKAKNDLGINVEALYNYKQAKSQLQAATSLEVKESSFGANVTELVAAAFVPFSDQMMMLGLVPGDVGTNVADYLASGAGKAAIRERLLALDIEDRTLAIQSFQQLFKDLSDSTGATLLPAGFLGDVLDPDYEGSIWYHLDNAITALDAVYVSAVVTTPYRALRAGRVAVGAKVQPAVHPGIGDTTEPTSPVNTVSAVNGEAGQELMKAAVASDEVAETLAGANSASEVYRAKAMPKFSDVGKPLDTDHIPSLYNDYEVYAAKLQSEIMDSANISGIQLTRAEQEAQQAKMIKDLGDNVNNISLREASTTIVKKEDGYDVSAVYGKTSTEGWRSFELAVYETAESLAPYGVSLEDINVMVKMPDGVTRTVTVDEARALSKELGDTLDVYTSVNFNKYWDNAGVQGFIKDDETLTTRSIEMLRRNLGAAADWLINPINRYDKSITSVINVMKDRGTAVTGLLVDMAKPLTDLNTASRTKVVKLLRDGDANSKKYSKQELQGMVTQGTLTDKEAVAILANYKFWDTAYILDNRSYARSLAEKGYWITKGVDSEDLPFNFIGKKVDSVEEGSDVLDIFAGAKYSGTGEGRSILKLKDVVKGPDGNFYKYVVAPTKATDLRLIKPTDNVLEYREGYYPRRYRGDYYVDMIVKDKRGNIIETKAIANAESKFKAEQHITTMDKTPNIEYTVRASKELQRARDVNMGNDIGEMGLFSDIERGRSIQRYRGQHLSGMNDKGTLDLAPTQDPFESMMSSAFNTGRVALHQDAIGSLENRWLKTFGHLVGDKGYPETTPRFLRGKENEIAEAIEMYKYIEGQKAIVDTYFTKRLFKRWVSSLAEGADMMSEIPGMESLAKVLRSSMISKIDPVKLVRTSAFLAYLVGNPARQALLQTSQLAQLMPLTSKYVNPKRLLQDTFALKATSISSIDAKAYTKTLEASAKSMGISVEDMKLISENFRKSGLPFSIDSNNLVEGLQRGIGGEVYDSLTRSYLSTAVHKAGSPLRFAKKIGFDWGELNNLAGTYVVAMERVRKGGKISSLTPRQWAEIGDEARRLSWNMTNVDNFAYQTGLVSVPTQFAQVFHKALLFYAFGNRTLTASERAKIVGFNTAFMVGVPTGIYFTFFEDALKDAPSDVKEVVNQGLLNYGVNTFIEGATLGLTGEDIEVNINLGGFSPAYGLLDTVVEAFQPFMEGDYMGTPGLQAIDKGLDFLHKSHLMMTGDFGFDVSTPERALKATVTGLSMFSGVNNMNKALIAASLEKQYFLNSKLQPVTESNIPEIIAHGLFGLTPAPVEAMYKFTGELYGSGNYTKTDAKEIAEIYYDVARRFTIGEAREEELLGLEFVFKSIEESDFDTKQMIHREVLKLDEQSSQTYQDRLFSQFMKKETMLTKEQVEAARRYIHLHGDRAKGVPDMFDQIFKDGEQ